MNEKVSSLTPVHPYERIQALDIMRGVVLCGILLMNINGFGLAGAYQDPTVSGGAAGLNLYTWITTNLLFEGTMRGLFSLLFGVGMFILIDRLEKKGAGLKSADIYFRRLLYLLVFGLIHGYLLLWTGEILYDYALMGFLVFSFRHLPPKKLIIIALILMSIGSFWSYRSHLNNIQLVENVALAETLESQDKVLSAELKEAKIKWEGMQEKRSPAYIADYNENMNKGYIHLVGFLAKENMKTDLVWPYRYDLWDILSMMLIGIALFKWNVLSAGKSFKFYFLLMFTGYGIGLAVNSYEVNMILDSQFDFVATSKSSITYDLGRLGICMGHIGLILLLCKSNLFQDLKRRMAAVGKMALTNYVMHSIICMFIFTGVGFGMFGKLQRFELLYVVFGIWIFQLMVSPIWLKYFHFGPLEWLWRNLSYQKIHPIRKTKTIPAAPVSPAGI